MTDFSYGHFHEILVEKGKDSAFKYYRRFHGEDNVRETLGERLEILSKLEKDYHLRGLSISPKNDMEAITTLEIVDYVVKKACTSAEVLNHWGRFPKYPPRRLSA